MQPIEINKHQFFKIELLEVPYSLTHYESHRALTTYKAVGLAMVYRNFISNYKPQVPFFIIDLALKV